MGNPDAFVVLNADIMGDYPLQEFVEFHQQHLGEHSILATEVRILLSQRKLQSFCCYHETCVRQ